MKSLRYIIERGKAADLKTPDVIHLPGGSISNKAAFRPKTNRTSRIKPRNKLTHKGYLAAAYPYLASGQRLNKMSNRGNTSERGKKIVNAADERRSTAAHKQGRTIPIGGTPQGPKPEKFQDWLPKISLATHIFNKIRPKGMSLHQFPQKRGEIWDKVRKAKGYLGKVSSRVSAKLQGFVDSLVKKPRKRKTTKRGGSKKTLDMIRVIGHKRMLDRGAGLFK